MNEDRAALESQSIRPAPAKAGAGYFRLRVTLRGLVVTGMLFSTILMLRELATGLKVSEAQAHGTAKPSFAYLDGPPAGFSGGFGEDHCQACHQGEKVNVAPGRVTISAPERYTPGETYTLTVTVTRPGMGAGGFLFTARFEDDSSQAGTLVAPDGQQDRVRVISDRGIQYARHLRPGTKLTAQDVARWTLRWTAPTQKRAVQFNVAANAANGNENNSGDFIYTSHARSRGR